MFVWWIPVSSRYFSKRCDYDEKGILIFVSHFPFITSSLIKQFTFKLLSEISWTTTAYRFSKVRGSNRFQFNFENWNFSKAWLLLHWFVPWQRLACSASVKNRGNLVAITGSRQNHDARLCALARAATAQKIHHRCRSTRRFSLSQKLAHRILAALTGNSCNFLNNPKNLSNSLVVT